MYQFHSSCFFTINFTVVPKKCQELIKVIVIPLPGTRQCQDKIAWQSIHRLPTVNPETDVKPKVLDN